MKLNRLADVLRDAGLKVEEQPGWLKRGGEMGDIKGVIAHHTAGPKSGIIPSLRTLIDGRPGLRGPLANLALGRTGIWYIIAAGKANHAGRGYWKGITHANTHYIGVEAENTGKENDIPWPPEQVESYIKGVAALLKHFKLPASAVIGHKEWAPKRKIDPTLDMDVFRKKVGEVMARKRKVEKEVIEDFYVPSTPAAPLEPEEAEVIDRAEAAHEESLAPENVKPGLHDPEPKAWLWDKEKPVVVPPKQKQSSSPTAMLESLGWTKEQAAALVAQAVVESNLDPNAESYAVNKQPTTKENPLAELSSFGIMKWNPARVANLDKFLQMWNHDNGQDRKRNDEEIQVRFVDWELRNTEKDAFNQLTQAKDLMSALRASTAYVRPPGWSIDTPESVTKWADRVTAAYGLLK